MRTTATSHVYVIGDPTSDGPVKIGTTENLPARLAAIKTGRSTIAPAGVRRARLVILATHVGGRRLERDLHQHYASARTVGEWFDLPPQQAHEIIPAFLADRSMVETVIRRGTSCHCYRCTIYPPSLAPGDRHEFADPSWPLLCAIHAMTHARLGVDLADDHVSLPASHCDIDRAVRLLEVLRTA